MKTKIIATIGPASSAPNILEELIVAGVDVFRLNFSHGNYEEFSRIIADIRRLSKKHNSYIAILADLQGPKIRIGEIQGGSINLNTDDTLTFTTDRENQSENIIFINYPDFPRDVEKDEIILLDDGKLTLRITATDRMSEVKARVIIGGKLSSRKGVNLPDTAISLPSLSSKDKEDIRFIVDHGLDWLGLSFVRSARDVKELSDIISSLKPENTPGIVAKIEKPEAVKNIESIIEVSDAIMIARGDLGVEVPLQRLPFMQKGIVKKCLELSKPVIIATQMMEGMINNAMPTRAEVNDVANSMLDGADALMLSGETSVGRNPVESVRIMQRIISEIELHEEIFFRHQKPILSNYSRFISDSLIFSGCDLAQEAGAKALVSVASSGHTATKISSKRPKSSIYIFSTDESLLCRLNLVWGIRPMYFDMFINTDQTISDLMGELKNQGLTKPGDLIVHISNIPLTEPGKSNLLKLSIAE